MAVNQDPSKDARQRRREAEIQSQGNPALTGGKAPEGSFTNYKPVPGKPGLEVDPFGHFRYTPKEGS